MSQDDIFAAALDAELFASDEGDGSGPSEAADDDAAVAAARGGGDDGDGRSGGKSNSSDDPFAALDDMEGEPEEQPQPQQQEQEQQQQQQRQEKASCSHPGYMFGLCIRCGAAKPEDGDGQGPSGSAAGDVSAEEAARITASAIPALLASRRLVLVLDLDHTLLNSVREGDVSADEAPLLAEILRRQQAAEARTSRGEDGGSEGGKGEAPSGERQAPEQEEQQEEGREEMEEGGREEQRSDGDEQPAPATGAEAAVPSASAGGSPTEAAELPPSLGHWHPPLLFHLSHCRLWTKLRPGVHEFLQEASRLYELHIYTMGDRAYAREIAGLLDPGGRLFAGRVVSAGDSTKSTEKGLDVLLASEAHVLILDDTEHVWTGHRRNLIQVERYHFFGSSIRSWQLTARGLLEDRTDEPPGSGMLATCLRVLREVHAEFFADAHGGGGGGGSSGACDPASGREVSADAGGGGEAGGADPGGGGGGALKRGPTKRRRLQGPDGGSGRSGSEGPAAATGSAPAPLPAPARALDPAMLRGRDVRACLADARARVLRGCCVCFSRCWPQHVTPFEQPLWVLAESLGADCSTRYTPGRTSHVVAAPDRGGELPLTDKVQAARRDGVAVVHYDWLLASKFSWGRADEGSYQMPAYTASGRAAGARARGFSWRAAGGASDAARDAAIAMGAAGRAGP